MDDVRQKVVEEPTYGRAVTDGQKPEPAPECETTLQNFYGIQLNIGDVTIDTSSREQDVEIDTGDIDIGDDE